MELAGRTVMVTGASGGIGEPLCAALIAAGARVLAVGRNEGRLRRLAQHLPAGALSWVAADVATDEGRAQVVRAAGNRLAPHSPYFGPGYWASLQLAAAIDIFEVFEFLYVRPEAWCGLDPVLPVDGVVRIPVAPGIGFEPDMSVIERFRV